MSNLKKVRESAGLSQAQLAEKSGVSKRTLQGYEIGLRNIDGANLETIVTLAEVLECSISDILENEDLKSRLVNVV